MLASNDSDPSATPEGNGGRRVSREELVRVLGRPLSTWFTDSSSSGFRFHFRWLCGCSAYKGADVDRLCVYEACPVHKTDLPC